MRVCREIRRPARHLFSYASDRKRVRPESRSRYDSHDPVEWAFEPVSVPDMQPVALTIAGSDPSGGAGIQADLTTFHQFGVYGEAVITLLTVQNTRTVARVETVPVDLVVGQIQAVISDISPAAAKTGALGTVAIVEAVAELARSFTF